MNFQFVVLQFLLIFLASQSALAAARCFDVFAPQTTESFRRAVLRGVEMHDNGTALSHIETSSSVYLHGTSIESLQRSMHGDFFLGTPVKDFEKLSSFYGSYKKSLVVHAFPKDKLILDNRTERALYAYAEFAARRFYLLRYLQDHSLYNSYFIYDFMEVLDGNMKLIDLVDLYKDDPELMHKPQVLSKLKNVDTSLLLKNAKERKGVLLIIKSQVEKSVIVEKDVEHDGAVALMSPQGIPIKDIHAIIPLSKGERDELLRLVPKTNSAN